MRFPEWLYRLLPGDQGSQQLGVVWREAGASSAATTVGVSIYTVPNDKCLVLTNATLRSVRGAGQSVTRRRILADPPAGSTRYDIFDESLDSTAETGNWWSGEVVVPGGWRVRAECEFSAAVNPNETYGEIHGYLIPRGTFVFG